MKKLNNLKFIIIFVLFFPLLLSLFFTIFRQDVNLDDIGLYQVEFKGEFSYDNTTWHTMMKKEPKLEKGTRIWMRGHFDKAIAKNTSIWFLAENIGVKFKLQDKELLSIQQPDSFPAVLKTPGSGWYTTNDVELHVDDEVSFEFLAYGKYNATSITNFLKNIYIGDGSGLYKLMISQFDVITFISLMAVLAGILYLLEGTIYDIAKMEEGKRIQLLGFYLFAGGLWAFTDCLYPYMPLFITPSWLIPLLDMSGVLLFPIALALIVRFFIRSSISKKIMNMILLIAVMAMVSAIVILLVGTSDLYQQEVWLGCIGMIQLNIVLLCIGVDLKKYKKGYMWLLLFAIFPALIVIFIESLNGVMMFMPKRIMMRYGFSISVIIMISQLSAYAKVELETKKSIEHMKEELTKSRIAIMLSQIQPHFLYNALESIGDLCTKNPIAAEDAITDFSLFLRGNLDSLVSEKLITFKKELEHTQYYLKLEKLRFGKRLCVKIETDVIDFYLPCLTLQPIVENAVRYGVTRRKKGGTITITTSQDDTAYIIRVQDDGVGFQMDEKQMEEERTHIGLKNVEHRLKIQCSGTLAIQSIPSVGTTVVIRITKERTHELKNNRCR